MSKQLLISDANILIDIKVAGLINEMFRLQYEYAVPGLLFEQELKQNHADLIAKGLRLLDLETSSIGQLDELGNKYKGISRFDLMALMLARTEQVPLLTGDRKLRQVCMIEEIEVRGTLWLIERMFTENFISVRQAEVAYQRMQDDGSRLPWDEVEKQLRRFGQ
jgi:predicted nucleic acid-binding protein